MRAEFDETLVTGNDMIDSQHKELIDRINQLLESCEEGQGKIKAVKMLDYLLDYTVFHFEAEEKLQEEYDEIEAMQNDLIEKQDTIRVAAISAAMSLLSLLMIFLLFRISRPAR